MDVDGYGFSEDETREAMKTGNMVRFMRLYHRFCPGCKKRLS